MGTMRPLSGQWLHPPLALLSMICLLEIGQGEVEYTTLYVDSLSHTEFGLAYPMTYQFEMSLRQSGLIVQSKHLLTEEWATIKEKDSLQFFNGIEAVRFDYARNMAYVSMSFGNASDSIYVRLLNGAGEAIPMAFRGVPKYYDDRQAVVTASSDDWSALTDSSFKLACALFRHSRVWLSAGIITDFPGYPAPWQSIQAQLDSGYVEASSHSRTHPRIPYTDAESEIRGSKEDILNNLLLPSTFKYNQRQYLYVWIAPYGNYDSVVDSLLGLTQYLIPRLTFLNSTQFAEWDTLHGHYYPIGITSWMEDTDYGGSTTDVAFLNATFDTTIARGSIYHLMFHPYWVDWSDGSYAHQHLDHIKEMTNLWYVSIGHLYLYHYLQENVNKLIHIKTPPPRPPAGIAAASADQKITISWKPNIEPNLSYYVIYRSVSGGFTPTNADSVAKVDHPDTLFTSTHLSNGTPYYFRLVAIVSNGDRSTFSGEVAATPGVLASAPAKTHIDEYRLFPNYPNPFNPVTTIRYDLPEVSRVSLAIYNLAGEEMRIWDRQEPAGHRHVTWDGRDESGQQMPTGIYIYRLVATSIETGERFVTHRKMVLLK